MDLVERVINGVVSLFIIAIFLVVVFPTLFSELGTDWFFQLVIVLALLIMIFGVISWVIKGD